MRPFVLMIAGLGLLTLFIIPETASAGDPVRGRGLYGEYCRVCHGLDGNAGVRGGVRQAANFANLDANPPRIKALLMTMSEDDHKTIVMMGGAYIDGAGHDMPATPHFRSNPRDLDDVVAYVLSLPAFTRRGSTVTGDTASSAADISNVAPQADVRDVNYPTQISDKIPPATAKFLFKGDPGYQLSSRPSNRGSAELVWLRPTGVDSKSIAGYHVYRSQNTKGLQDEGNRIRTGLTSRNLTVEKMSPGLYYYEVQAVLKDGTLAPVSEPVPVLVRNQILAATGPTYNLMSRPDKTGSAFLDWNRPKGPEEKLIATYNVYRSDNVEGLVQEANRVLSGVHGSSTVVEKVAPGLYYYAVEAVRKDGTALPPSDPVPVLVLDH